MPKYLFYGMYTPEGYQGLVQEGGSKRIEAAKQALRSGRPPLNVNRPVDLA